MKIYIVEDDAVIASGIAAELESWGFAAVCAQDFSDIAGEFVREAPQLVIMDVSLPYYNGYYWCERIRKLSDVPVVFLSSRDDDADVIMAVNMGGDDYIAKPVSMEVLVAKIRSMLRRAYDYEGGALTVGGATLDAAGLRLIRGEERFTLTRNEAKLLSTLLRRRGSVVTREELMLSLWDSDEFVDENTLTVNINRLRKTLGAAGIADCIVTHKNIGYAIDE